MTNLTVSTIRAVVSRFPAVVPLLKGRARWIAYTYTSGDVFVNLFLNHGIEVPEQIFDGDTKTYDYYLSTLERMIRNVYNGELGGAFIDLLANLISGQLTQAFQQAWDDEGDGGEMPEYLTGPLEDMILSEYDHVDQFYRDIIDAKVDETPIDPLLARAPLWAGQWNTAYREAVRLIQMQNGGNFVWRKGETEHGCSTCAALDGIVASAREWEELGVHPRGYPNPLLECQGGGPANHCDCTLEPTEQRRSPDAYGRIMDIVSR